MAEPVVVRPTARLVGTGWVLVVVGVVLLVGGWALGFSSSSHVSDVTAPFGWVALAAGVAVVIWSAVRKARNRDVVQARQL